MSVALCTFYCYSYQMVWLLLPQGVQKIKKYTFQNSTPLINSLNISHHLTATY